MENKKKFNKKHLIWILPIFVLTIVTAAWLFSFEGGFSMIVDSIPGYISVSLETKSLSVNTTNSSSSSTETISFILNKDMFVEVDIIEVFQDNSGGNCTGGQSDCTIVYQIYNESSFHTITHGEIIELNAMPYSRNLTATLSCVAYSCPQSRAIDIKLTEVNI